LEEECRVAHGTKTGRNDIKVDEETLHMKLRFSYFTPSETDSLPLDSS